jgi:CheY-like chemotaxis protein
MSALRKVLVVDDDPVVGKSFNRVLSGKGYVVITAQDGPEALKRLAEGEYDLVFTDIKMPGMDGIEVAERVKAKRPWIPVVIVTGYGSEANEARAKAAGVSGFLHKPLSPEVIEGSARNALEAIAAAPVAATAAPAAALAPAEGTTATAMEAEPAGMMKLVYHVEPLALALVAPLVGLAFVVAAPFVGLAMLAWTGLAAMARHAGVAKNIAMMLAAPVIGLAYAVAMPFIGLGALAWMALREIGRRRAALARAAGRAGRYARNVALFFAAPFIGLAYAVAFPFIGLYLLVTGMMKKAHAAK